MQKISPEYLTMLAGAKALIEVGYVSEAENVYRQLLTLAKVHGNDDEKETCVSAYVGFLRTRGRFEEAERLSSNGLHSQTTSLRDSKSIDSEPLAVKDIIVVGSSAGGMEAVETLLSKLPLALNASVFVVQQIPGHSPSELVQTLNRRSKLPVEIPRNGETIVPNRVYLAPPNQHLIVKKGSICLGNGPKENRARPAIDVLFRTAAHAYGTHVIAVLLSGVLNDGTSGLMSIKTHGGLSIVQDPEEAVFDAMPRSAISFTNVDYVLKMTEIGPLIGKLIADGLVGEDQGGSANMPEYRDQADIGEVGGPGIENVAPYPPSALTCPSCGGAVWQFQENSLTLFKCHTGHSFTAELMLEEQSEAVDAAAWILLRSISESVFLRRKLAEWARSTGRSEEAKFHEQQAVQAENKPKLLEVYY